MNKLSEKDAFRKKFLGNEQLLNITAEFIRHDHPIESIDPLHPQSFEIFKRWLGVGQYSTPLKLSEIAQQLNMRKNSIYNINHKTKERVALFHKNYCENEKCGDLQIALFKSLILKLCKINPSLNLSDVTAEMITETLHRIDENPFEIFNMSTRWRISSERYRWLWKLFVAHAKSTGLVTIRPATETFINVWPVEKWHRWYCAPCKRPCDRAIIEWRLNRLERIDQRITSPELLMTLDDLREIILIVTLKDGMQ